MSLLRCSHEIEEIESIPRPFSHYSQYGVMLCSLSTPLHSLLFFFITTMNLQKQQNHCRCRPFRLANSVPGIRACSPHKTSRQMECSTLCLYIRGSFDTQHRYALYRALNSNFRQYMNSTSSSAAKCIYRSPISANKDTSPWVTGVQPRRLAARD